MAGIEIGYLGIPEPTVCGPVSQFRDLTLSSNAIRMGEYGTLAGLVIAAGIYLAYTYVGPRVYEYGSERGWWS